MQLNSSSALRRARREEDLRDAVPGEKISDAGREVSGSFLRALFRYPLPLSPRLLRRRSPRARWCARDRNPAGELTPLNARKAGERMVVGQDPASSALE